MNERVTSRERGLIKGALRRVFSRSELRRKVLRAAIVEHTDPSRKRVKTWVTCNICGKPEAISNAVVDHLDPLIPVNTTFEQMSLDTVVDRLWCEENNLQVVDQACHKEKTAIERKQRRKKK
jgi:CRISPR/Cas system CSM-associated protein Csm3 (group 7 of RAMP superfamily)